MKSTVKPIDKKTGMLIAKNLIVLLVLVAVGFFSSFSWFTTNTESIADGISIESKAPDGLEIAIVEHGAAAPSNIDYVQGTIQLNAENCEFLEDLFFTEITGSGKNDEFYKPKLTQSNGLATPDTEADWDLAVANGHYISFDLYMRSKSEQKVYLQETSSVKPVSSVLTWADGTDATAYNPSTYGNFSRDCVVGAVRFSMVDSTAEENLKLLWIPAPHILLAQTADSVSTTQTSGDSYAHTYYTVTESAKQQETTSDVIANNDSKNYYTLGQQKLIATLDNRADNDEYYTDYVTCHLWIEGEDAEARLALTGGKFVLSLQLAIDQ